MPRQPFNVLFLCTGNSARSILAECLMRERGKASFHAFSAGSFPQGEVHPIALRLLAEQGMPTDGLRSKSWDEFSKPGAPVVDFVFTVCDRAAGEVCPIWPGQPITAHWGVPDPAAVDGSDAERMLGFRDAFRMLDRRIGLFLALPFDSLDRIAIRREADAIGRVRSDNEEDRVS
jgi:arsenate reductase